MIFKWQYFDNLLLTAYQLQYGPIVDVYPDDPGKITITWLNTDLFQSGELSADLAGEGEGEGEREVARYVILFYGKDFGGTVRANFSISHTARRSQSKLYSLRLLKKSLRSNFLIRNPPHWQTYSEASLPKTFHMVSFCGAQHCK